MSDFARVDNIDALREFRAALWKFAETAQVALGDAESDLTRTLMWLDTEMSTYWAGQVRKRQELVSRAAEKLREKRLFKDATGRPPSAVDEEKAWKLAKQKLADAEDKVVAIKRYKNVLQKAMHDYKGSVQTLSTAVAHGIPVSVARLDKLAGLLRQYVELSAPGGESESAAPGAPDGAMARPPGDTAVLEPAAAVELPPDFPSFESPQVVSVQTHRPTGLILAADGKGPAEDGNQYRRFASVTEAEQFARLRVEQDPMIEFAILGQDGRVLMTVSRDGEQ